MVSSTGMLFFSDLHFPSVLRILILQFPVSASILISKAVGHAINHLFKLSKPTSPLSLKLFLNFTDIVALTSPCSMLWCCDGLQLNEANNHCRAYISYDHCQSENLKEKKLITYYINHFWG